MYSTSCVWLAVSISFIFTQLMNSLDLISISCEKWVVILHCRNHQQQLDVSINLIFIYLFLFFSLFSYFYMVHMRQSAFTKSTSSIFPSAFLRQRALPNASTYFFF